MVDLTVTDLALTKCLDGTWSPPGHPRRRGGQTRVRKSKAECKQFNGGDPAYQDGECHRIVFEPNTHDIPHIADRV